MKTQTNSIAQTRIQVHIVMPTRHRRRLFTSAAVNSLFANAIDAMCAADGLKATRLNIAADHIRLCADIPPELSVADVVHDIKRYTTRALKESELSERNIAQIWTRSYYATTAEKLEEKEIDAYLETIKKR